MARLRLLLIAALVLAVSSCYLLEQQDNFISFTWDGVQYLFTASAATEERPWAAEHSYAVGYALAGGDPISYEIVGSATPEDAVAGTNTIAISLHQSGGYWDIYISLFHGSDWDNFTVWDVPDSMLDSFIENRDTVGAQVTGSLPGPFQGESPVLENIVFSVERLPDEPYVIEMN